ncbi:hypothetical protein [Saccharothrix stipae]
MIGFELEISLLIADRRGRVLDGETPLASCPQYQLKIVSDKRQGYSNIEFVTDPVSVTGADSKRGPETLAAQVRGIRAMRDALYAAKPGPFADAIAPYGTAVDEGRTARIRKFPPRAVYQPAEADGRSDGLFLHYSLGVPVGALAGFFDLLRDTIAPFTPDDPRFLDRARFRTAQAAEFAESVVTDFAVGGATGDQSLEVMRAYMQLVYTQIAGIADYTDHAIGVKPRGQVKNGTVALCRASFHEIFPALPEDVRKYLEESWSDESMIERIAATQDITEKPDVHADFNENDIREIPGLPAFSLKQYLKSALTGGPQVPQSSMYGKMTLVPPHRENGVDLIVFELRTTGDHHKTWAQVTADLQLLVTWVQGVSKPVGS